MKKYLFKCLIMLAGFFFALMAAAPISLACSRVLWKSGDHVYVGRTQDWTERVNSSFRKFPRGIERVGAVAENPHRWTSKYGSLILTGYDIGTHEGVNEKGLNVHLLYLAEDADFGQRDSNREAISIMQWAQYFLDNYASVAEAVAAVNQDSYQIESITLPNGKPALLHLAIADKTGDSAVIEYVGGNPVIYHDRKYTVVTNEPTYDKQLENLKQYRSFGGDKPLPGERTPSDRFVRAAYYSSVLPEAKNNDTGVAYIFSVIRNISVPFGAADPDKPNVSNTIFRSVIDVTGERYFFESTYAPNVVWIDYTKLDFSADSPETALPVEKMIFTLNGDISDQMEAAEPFTFGGNIHH